MKREKNKKLRSYAERIKDRYVESDLILRGYNLKMIAEKINLSERTVRRDLVNITETWKKELTLNTSYYITRQLKELSLIKLEAWEARDKSKAGENWGEAQFLMIVEKAIGREAKLLNLNGSQILKEDEIKKDTEVDEKMIQRVGRAIARRIKEMYGNDEVDHDEINDKSSNLNKLNK